MPLNLSTLITVIAIYLIIWWTVLFAVLPLGTHGPREKPTDGSDWGAPDDPQLKKKFLTTTWVSAIVWVVAMIVIWTGVIPLDMLPGPPPPGS